MLVDTHAHLNFKDFQKNLDQVVRRSLKAGVGKIVCVSSNVEDAGRAIKIAQKYPGVVYAAVGIHPQQTDPQNPDSPEKQIQQLANLAQEKEVVAIGECGLDLSPAPPGEKDRSKDEQKLLFQEQIKLSLQLNKPLIVHSRKAFEETINLLLSTSEEGRSVDPPSEVSNSRPLALSPRLSGVFHCYSAGKKGIARVDELGFLFGADGNLTYDEGLQNVFAQIPLEKILLETDCPFLAPEPYRGQTSEPAHVKLIAEFLAKVKKVPFEKVAKTTTQNAKNLFNI